MPLVKDNRRSTGDAYSFNWSIKINHQLQIPFEPTHENMASLNLYPGQSPEKLASDLRRAFRYCGRKRKRSRNESDRTTWTI